jgi:hypothetical protein
MHSSSISPNLSADAGNYTHTKTLYLKKRRRRLLIYRPLRFFCWRRRESSIGSERVMESIMKKNWPARIFYTQSCWKELITENMCLGRKILYALGAFVGAEPLWQMWDTSPALNMLVISTFAIVIFSSKKGSEWNKIPLLRMGLLWFYSRESCSSGICHRLYICFIITSNGNFSNI